MLRREILVVGIVSCLLKLSSGVDSGEFHQNSKFVSSYPGYTNRNTGYSNLIDNVKTGVNMLNSFMANRNGPTNNNNLVDSSSNQIGVSNNYIDDKNENEPIRQREGNWMQSAQSFINGPGGQMALTMAKEFISRSGGGNQILSLNLTNLLILVFLKALIFAAGLIGAGSWGGHYGRGRGMIDDYFLDNRDVQLFLGFLATEGSGQDGCLYKAACESPTKAKDYLKAGRALLQGSGMLNNSLPNNVHYNEILQKLQLAIMEGMEHADCDMIYSCHM